MSNSGIISETDKETRGKLELSKTGSRGSIGDGKNRCEEKREIQNRAESANEVEGETQNEEA
jgi:hypothetical protein